MSWGRNSQMSDPKTQPPRKPRALARRGSVLAFFDQNLMWFSAFIVMCIWIGFEIAGKTISDGARMAFGTFIAVAGLKAKTDSRWRELEIEAQETKQLLDALQKTAPGSPEAQTVRKALAEQVKRSQASGTEEEP